MKARDFKFHQGAKGAALAIRVKTGARRETFKRILRDGTVVVQLKGPGGDLDKKLVQFLSRELKISQSRVQIIAGQDGKDKLVSIMNMNPEQIQQAILDRIG